jgi:phytoene synthase
MRDRDLVRLHWPRELRPAFDALFGIDDAMAHVVASASQPAMGAIKLAWWRESLAKLDHAPPPAEPRLKAVASELLPREIRGSELAELEAGWATLLDERPSDALIERRGATLFRLGAHLLGQAPEGIEAAGALFAVADVGRRGLHAPRGTPFTPAAAFPAKVRPLTSLAALALRDLSGGSNEPEATPGRSWTVLRHRLTGRL